MNRDIFAATIAMLGWKKEGKYQYSKVIGSATTLILCRKEWALVINDLDNQESNNKYIDYYELIEIVQNEFRQ